ncbi:MAG: bifunctional phosphopantothenoylcysteine decarboxylase/phosphopantothenate--cysteine ligase CoaBC [Bacteroidales bacterium]|jgi:phosphopantothenoylcysteine decarboxylase/phosphopantothenate--cysteine ligase|nr:bifunctional phosphopantothenoylcysteine decarboxylase/phosphopantothenate--cysteine ligase CoaBC [Paludibacteraceae bacterium]MCR5246895.1 bifunctional phosphopantothenoylcysteine decarboxylase/phosphopantothenate--cysteine ligase CoaBC [Paludibacteraceae bacterium]MDO4524785.1 bifunctional phosphopantothenoylcysteine decarboxylase/phosphopantothenate--cysteine ligase CoaBC [Bacteroidales bacterium]
MSTLSGKHILLGITGGIAAYKCAPLVREFVKRGAEVKVVMTPLAKQFITPLTMATLSKNPILVDFFNPENGEWNSHVNLGMWADVYLIAPATANTIGKMANGVADNLLLTSYLSAKCPVFFAPAMDLDMYKHPAVQKNIATLISYGNHVIEPGTGFLASGLEGKGRMAEPSDIVVALENFFESKSDMAGKKVMITAGPTYEKIDPVRFIGNYSSGKMGFALAEECADRGAEVTLIAGPTSLKTVNGKINRINVESAQQMYDAAVENSPSADVQILCAAVADYRPSVTADKKIKREKTGEMTLTLVPNPDIAAALGKIKRENQVNVGFALETNDEATNAKDKCARKNFDFIVMNSLKDKGAGFQVDTNKITIFTAGGDVMEYPLKTKKEVAADIVDAVVEIAKKKGL